MNADDRSEIAASVAAHAELGPQYDAAVAEGLVERIGAEIDRRIDARLHGNGQPEPPRRGPQPTPLPSQPMPGQPMPGPMPGGQAMPGQPMLGQPMFNQPMPGLAAPSYLMPQPMPAPALQQVPQQVPTHRGTGATFAGVILALGSMAMGIGATAVVVHNPNGSNSAVILLIWLAIVIINGVHARFYWRPDENHHRGHKG